MRRDALAASRSPWEQGRNSIEANQDAVRNRTKLFSKTSISSECLSIFLLLQAVGCKSVDFGTRDLNAIVAKLVKTRQVVEDHLKRNLSFGGDVDIR